MSDPEPAGSSNAGGSSDTQTEGADTASGGETSAGAGGGATQYVPQVGIAISFLVTLCGGLALFGRAAALGLGFDDPQAVENVGVFAAVVLGATGVMIVAFRYGRGETLLRAVLVAVFGWLVGLAVVLGTGIGEVVTEPQALEGLPASPLPAAVAVLAAAVLWSYPEWYVLNLAGVVGGAAGIAVLGISFGPRPIVVLLVLWAAYDAYAVYWSGHMKEIASGAMELQVPVVFVVPQELHGSIRGGALAADDEFEGSLLGLGDALIPGMLAVSAAEFLDAPVMIDALNANAPALGTLAGAVVGILLLNYIVSRWDGVHAGLPPLVTCVLAGYLLGAAAGGVSPASAVGF